MVTKQTIVAKLLSFEKGETQNGKHMCKFATSMGDFTCFEEDVSKNLYALEGQVVKFEIAIRPSGHKNLVGFVGLADEKTAEEVEKMQDTKPQAKAPNQSQAPVSKAEQVVINKEIKLNANSLEIGKAGSRMKIYFEDEKDLTRKGEAFIKAQIDLEIFEKAMRDEADSKEETPTTN
jgi:hypothetical protein